MAYWVSKRRENCVLPAHLSFGSIGLAPGPLGGSFQQALHSVPGFSEYHAIQTPYFWTLIIPLHSARQPGVSPDYKKNDRHLQTVCMFCAITSLLVKFHKSWHMAFEDDTSAANTRRPFSEILPRLEPAANAISIWFIARNFWYESKVRSKISFSLARLTKKFAHGFHRNYLRRLYAKLSFK